MIKTALRLPTRLLRTFILLTALVLLPGCGIDFSESDRGEDLFKAMTISGDPFVNRELTVSLDVTVAYPVPVKIACYYENRAALRPEQRNVPFAERALLIGERVLPPAEADHPSDGAPRETIRFAFSVPTPGVYYLGCLTPAAPENRINMNFEVRPAIDAVAQAR
jgi:hypothetical protein